MRFQQVLSAAFGVTLLAGLTAPAFAQNPPQRKPLEAGAQKVRLTLEDLRTVGLDLKNMLKATSSLYDEVTIQPMQMITQPDVVGPGVIINIPIRAVPSGPVQPARPKRVQIAMATIKPNVDQFKSTVDDFMSGEKQLDLPDDIHQTVQPNLDAWIQTVNTISTQEQQLEQLTANSPYDQPAIAQTCVAMEKNIKSLDEIRRAIYKVLKKHAKQLGLS